MYKIWLIFLLSALLTAEEIKSVVATGSGVNQSQAEQAACRNALEQVVGSYVESETITKNSSVVRDSIYSATNSFIKNYQVLSSEESSGGKRVVIRAEVNTTGINRELRQLGLLMMKLDMPRIMVLNLKEESGEMSDLAAKGYMGVIQSLTDGGLFIIDKNEQEKFLKEQKISAYAELNNRIADFGLQINADFVIRFDLKLASDQGSVYIDAEVISPSTGKILFSLDEVAQLDNSLNEIDRIVIAKNAGKTLGSRLYRKIIENWKYLAENGTYFTLVLEGAAGYSKILTFQKWLGDINGVLAVSEVESSDQKSTLLIKYNCKRSELKEKIFKLFTQKGWVARLVRSENNRIFIKVLN